MATEQKLKQKIKQNEKDVKTLQQIGERLKEQLKEQLRKKNWIAAIGERRLILNLSALDEFAKDRLMEAIKRNLTWISFTEHGNHGTTSLQVADVIGGLSFYVGTKVVFGNRD